jgi:hypothetical protein
MSSKKENMTLPKKHVDSQQKGMGIGERLSYQMFGNIV